MPIASQTIIKRLQAAGWYKVGQTGSHVHFKHSTKPGKVTVPHPRRDFSIGTLKSIERQSGVKLRQPPDARESSHAALLPRHRRPGW